MRFSAKISAIILFSLALFTLAACGNDVDNAIDAHEKIIEKIERIAQKDSLSEQDYEEFKKLIAEYRENDQKQIAKLKGATFTEDQQKRAMAIVQRLQTAMTKCEMKRP